MRTETETYNAFCAKCQKGFSCCSEQVENCHCSKATLSEDLRKELADAYTGCLCESCLNELSKAQALSVLKTSLAALLLFFSMPLSAQFFAPAAGQAGTSAMHRDSSAFRDWAVTCTVQRGWQDISNLSLGKVTAGDSVFGTGKALINGAVSLGDGGNAICAFNAPIVNGPGPDFAVFENSFDGQFLELAFVEVSSDGINYFRFPSACLVDSTVQTGTFGNTDARLINNLAGKYVAAYGTPFDLDELKSQQGLNVNAVTHVKLLDVIGALNVSYASRDAAGRKINDPWPTPFAQGGFDLDAVGVIHSAASTALKNQQIMHLRLPQMMQQGEDFQFADSDYVVLQMHDLQGRIVYRSESGLISTNRLEPGIYLLSGQSGGAAFSGKLLIY